MPHVEKTDEIRTINPVVIDWYGEDEVVEVFPRDQQRFEIQKDRAISALERIRDGERFDRQFRLLQRVLASWIHAHADKVQNPILTLNDGALLFLVVQVDTAYDEELEDALSELDFSIANDADLDLISLNTMCMPPVSKVALRSFVDERLTISYHGHRERPHQGGEPVPRDAGLSD